MDKRHNILKQQKAENSPVSQQQKSNFFTQFEIAETSSSSDEDQQFTSHPLSSHPHANLQIEVGKWPLFIYLSPISSSRLKKTTQKVIQLQQNLYPNKILHEIPQTDWHVSLSVSTALNGEHQVQPFLNHLKTQLHNQMFNPISHITEYAWFSSREKTRTYLVLVCKTGQRQIASLISSVDTSMTAFGLETYPFKDPVPHISVAWFEGTFQETENVDLATHCDLAQDLVCPLTFRNSVCCLLGAKSVVEIPLSK